MDVSHKVAGWAAGIDRARSAFRCPRSPPATLVLWHLLWCDTRSSSAAHVVAPSRGGTETRGGLCHSRKLPPQQGGQNWARGFFGGRQPISPTGLCPFAPWLLPHASPASGCTASVFSEARCFLPSPRARSSPRLWRGGVSRMGVSPFSFFGLIEPWSGLRPSPARTSLATRYVQRRALRSRSLSPGVSPAVSLPSGGAPRIGFHALRKDFSGLWLSLPRFRRQSLQPSFARSFRGPQ